MGTELIAFYEEAKAIGGVEAQVRLAMMTKMSSVKAKEAEDNQENIMIFREAMSKIHSFYKK